MTWKTVGYAAKINGRMDSDPYLQILKDELLNSLEHYELQSPQQLYINPSTEDQSPQLGLLEPSPYSFYTRESSLSVTFESFFLQFKWCRPL